MDAGAAGSIERGQGARPPRHIGRQQRPVEVAGDRLDVGREVSGEDQPWVAEAMYAAMFAICSSLS
jgi:hypothetical protein